jgi:hypothetical protein
MLRPIAEKEEEEEKRNVFRPVKVSMGECLNLNETI